jgi:uroporphyrinogen-III synthase
VPVVVTRPTEEASGWTERLCANGVEAVGVPLIDIAAAIDPSPLREAWNSIAAFQAAMFVSANAVRHFFAQAPADARLSVRAWATGPGTSEALRAAGVEGENIDQPPADARQFDSEALWRVVQAGVRAGDRVLIVRGGDEAGHASGREWLAGALARAGAHVETVVAYRRVKPSWTAAQAALASARARDATWLFSSSEAIRNLRELMPAQAWGEARAIATHPRIVQAALDAGFGAVRECRPGFDEVLRCLRSLQWER